MFGEKLVKKMQNNNISKIMNMERPHITQAVYRLFQYSQSTTASVERSFSMLRNRSAKDRKFIVENVKQYMALHFNFRTL